ncbi:hypothetical protein EJ08DRAFT_711039 [Tothia fuscella]|uniref:Uncharacterized protein n=1 Tax=Tothia fuscella TaxID=1048955 RepID=A0A9P4U026_9PEZI|nr:hypothetical protein EJ08DRAFT_711039 [Tothia fuscella]
MGPNWSEFQSRIAGNLKRLHEFKTDKTSKSTYITVSCVDSKNYCKKRLEGKAVGGYAWTTSGWWAYYHYITMCEVFYAQDTLYEKIAEVERDLAKGDTLQATDMRYLSTAGQFFLHEMTHTRLVYDTEPEIIDENVNPIEGRTVRAYGLKLVHKLASWPIRDAGGARRSTTNADSYAMLANANYWWALTGYFPSAPKKLLGIAGTPISLHVDLGNNTDIRTANLNALFAEELAAYIDDSSDDDGEQSELWQLKGTPGGQSIASGIDLRILSVGDSITVGFLSDKDSGMAMGTGRS